MRANLGWNTWDVNHINGVVHLESGLRLRLIFLNTETGERKERFDWQNNLSRLGPHSGIVLGYARIDVKWNDFSAGIEFASESDRMVCRVDASRAQPMHLVVAFDGAWGSRIRPLLDSSGLHIRTGGTTWKVTPVSAVPFHSNGEEMEFNLDQPVLLDLSKAEAPISGTAHEMLAEQWIDYEQTRLKTGGWLEDGGDGLTRSIHWNTIWEPIKGRVCTPVSRDWCMNDFWGGYVLFDWDTFFCAMMATLESPELGKDNIRAILDEITPDGFVPNFGAARTVSNDRSQPPIGSYCILKVWRSLQLAASMERKGLLEETFNRLLQWHRWWLPNRDGNKDGLLEWGSSPLTDPRAPENHTLRAAMFESGLDNSPMYDEAVFNPSSHTMELSDVGLNALYALDAWALSEIAAEIGRNEEARALHEEYVGLAERINRDLWNESDGIYQNRRWDGEFSAHISPTNFYPLIAGIVPPERALRMIREHLLNEKEFWGEFVLPSISRTDPGYRQKEVVRDGIAEPMSDYWRGRIWGPMNFLVSEGLRRNGFDFEAHILARKSVRLFLQEWSGENHVHENYNDLTGEGDDVPSANALYHWGALLAYVGIQELADCEPWDGWRFGNLDSESALVEGIQVDEGRLVVRSGGAGLMVSVDRRVLLETDKAVIVRGYRTEPGRLQFRVSGETEQTNLKIGLPGSAISAVVKIRTGQVFEMGHVQTMRTDSEGVVEIDLRVPCEVEVIW